MNVRIIMVCDCIRKSLLLYFLTKSGRDKRDRLGIEKKWTFVEIYIFIVKLSKLNASRCPVDRAR